MSESRSEDEYFARLELEKKRKIREEANANQEAVALKERKERHHNKCGKCGDELSTVPFRGVEIDICPSCGAVLLDPGELEELAGTDSGGVISSFFETFFGK